MKLIIASNNAHKIREIKAILSDKFDGILSLKEADIAHETVEDGATFMENALKKAREICEISGCAALADDSGICAHALDGAPGIYSARYAGIDGGHGADAANNALLVKNLSDKSDKSAHYTCAMALVYPSGREVTAEGYLYGTIVDAGNAWLAGYVADMDNVYYSETEEVSLIVDEIAEGNWNSNMLSLMAADFAWNSDRGGDMEMRLRSIRALNTFGIHNEEVPKVLKIVEAYLANPEDADAVAAMKAEAQKMVDRYDAFGDLPTAGTYHVGIDLDEAILALQDYYIAMHLLSAMEEAANDPYINMDSVVTWFKDNGFKAIFTNIDLLDDEGIQYLL